MGGLQMGCGNLSKGQEGMSEVGGRGLGFV